MLIELNAGTIQVKLLHQCQALLQVYNEVGARLSCSGDNNC
jgi:hypothetical protein